MKVNTKLWRQVFYPLKYNHVLHSVYYLLIYLTLPTLVVLIPFCLLLKQLAYILLWLKYKNSFVGFLTGADAVWTVEDTSRNIINIVATIEHNDPGVAMQQIKDIIAEKIFSQTDHFVKLTSIRMRSMGFTFLLKHTITVDDCVSTINLENGEKISDSNFQKVISEYSNRPLPKENSGLWEILVSPNTIQRRGNQVLPVLLRFSHIVGDGLSLTNLFFRTFADNHIMQDSDSYFSQGIKNFTPTTFSENCKIPFYCKLARAFKNGIKWLKIFLAAPLITLYQNVLRKKDVHPLGGLSGEKILVCAVEQERKLLPLVKQIKEMAPGSRFSDILLTAISRSIYNFYSKNKQHVPEFATAVLPALLFPPNMGVQPILQNQFSVALLDLPVVINSKSIASRLQEVTRQTDKLRKSSEYLVNHLLLILCGIMPHPILAYCLKCDMLSMSISSVPGLPKISILNGSNIQDIIFYTPNRGTAGIGFSILTYDGRFQIGLEVDKSIIASAKEAQLIVDDILRYIHLMAVELIAGEW